jgi:hypothetical protein
MFLFPLFVIEGKLYVCNGNGSGKVEKMGMKTKA